MAKSKQNKKETIKVLTEKITSAKSLVFVNFSGLKVKEIEELRKKFRENNVDYFVAKKTLMKLGFQEAKLPVNPKDFSGEIAIAFSNKDEVTAAKVIEDFAQNHVALKTIGGVLENAYIDREKVIELSKLPSRLELISRVVGSIAAPLSGLVNVMQGNLRGLVYVFKAIKEKKSA